MPTSKTPAWMTARPETEVSASHAHPVGFARKRHLFYFEMSDTSTSMPQVCPDGEMGPWFRVSSLVCLSSRPARDVLCTSGVASTLALGCFLSRAGSETYEKRSVDAFICPLFV